MKLFLKKLNHFSSV